MGTERAAFRDYVHDVPDFPRPGVVYRDITPLLADPVQLRRAVDALVGSVAPLAPDIVVCPEARGFLLAAPIAVALGVALVPARKAGRLPGPTHSIDYELDYGPDRLEIKRGAVPSGARAVLVDDVLATGGTAGALVELVGEMGGQVVGAAFAVEITELGGREGLAGASCWSLVQI